MYNDAFQKHLERDLVQIYKNYQKHGGIDMNVIAELEKEDLDNRRKEPNKIVLAKPRIENGKLYFNTTSTNERPKYLSHLLENTLKWARKNKLKIPNTTLYIWISDRFPFHVKNIEQFPISVYARPEGLNMLVIPDETFYCMTIDKKYSANCHDWDDMKNIIYNKCNKVKDKEPVMYFKGVRTGQYEHDLRQKLLEYSKKHKGNPPLDIQLDGWINYQPIYHFCKYLYLLNLPGHYPWSNRLKYILLMDSVVINVNVELINIDPSYTDKKYISFIDYVVSQDNYIEIVYKYYRIGISHRQDKEKMAKLEIYQEHAFENFIKTLNDIYEDIHKHPQKYKKMIKKAQELTNKLTNDRIYNYFYRYILLNSELIE
jgi:hypothetical protein